MAGNGDINRRDAWSAVTSALTTGSHGTPPAQGGLNADGGDPDRYLGSFTLQVVTPTLGLASLAAVPSHGDLGDVYGAPDTSDPLQISGLVGWSVGTPTLTTGSHATPAGHGDIADVGGASTISGAVNDTSSGVGSLTSWNGSTPTLGTGTLPALRKRGDIGEMYGQGEGPIGQLVWDAVTPSLATQATTTPHGGGDIPNPYSWQDSVFYLTSRIYPVVDLEHFSMSMAILHQPTTDDLLDHLKTSLAWTAGTLNSALVTYTFGAIEHITVGPYTWTAGTLTLGLIDYHNGAVEHMTLSNYAWTAGTLVVGLIVYSDWPTEHISTSFAWTGGTLT